MTTNATRLSTIRGQSWSANNDWSEIKIDHYQESAKIITNQGWSISGNKIRKMIRTQGWSVSGNKWQSEDRCPLPCQLGRWGLENLTLRRICKIFTFQVLRALPPQPPPLRSHNSSSVGPWTLGLENLSELPSLRPSHLPRDTATRSVRSSTVTFWQGVTLSDTKAWHAPPHPNKLTPWTY